MKTRKTISIFAICLLTAGFAFGQQRNVKEIDVTPPQFTGVKNSVQIQNENPNTLIKQYLKDNIVYPEVASNCNLEGTEVVEFTVTTEGKVKNFNIVNSVCPMIDKEVIMVLSQTDGMWMPGIKNGKPAEMQMEIPFAFCSTHTGSKSIQDIFTEKATEFFEKGSIVLFEKENTKKALRYFDKGVTYLPYDNSLLLLRGVCRYELGDKEGANEDWTRMNTMGGPDMTELMTMTKDMKGYREMLAILKK